jgi:LmbE family N-acetylglucosaminyl deacetylase
VDSLPYQNPDVHHDLYAFKCVTTVVFTASGSGEPASYTRILQRERSLEEAYKFMDEPTRAEEPIRDESTVQIGKYNVSASTFEGMSNVQILYLRLPESTHTRQGYITHGGESLKKLYDNEIKYITTIDQNATYTLHDLKNIIATILRERRPNYIRVLNHLVSLPNNEDESEHEDHTVSAKLIVDVIKEEGIEANIQTYAGDFMRRLDANLVSSHRDFEVKVNTFLEYAKHDTNMVSCPNLVVCDTYSFDLALICR